MAKDFSKGSMSRNILQQAIPLAVAQLVHMLYNVVDRIYIGHMPDSSGALALTGLGITLPLISLISACTNLIGTGAVPIFSIARGAGNGIPRNGEAGCCHVGRGKINWSGEGW